MLEPSAISSMVSVVTSVVGPPGCLLLLFSVLLLRAAAAAMAAAEALNLSSKALCSARTSGVTSWTGVVGGELEVGKNG